MICGVMLNLIEEYFRHSSNGGEEEGSESANLALETEYLRDYHSMYYASTRGIIFLRLFHKDILLLSCGPKGAVRMARTN